MKGSHPSQTNSSSINTKNTACQKSTLILEGNNSWRSSAHVNELANAWITWMLKSQLQMSFFITKLCHGWRFLDGCAEGLDIVEKLGGGKERV